MKINQHPKHLPDIRQNNHYLLFDAKEYKLNSPPGIDTTFDKNIKQYVSLINYQNPPKGFLFISGPKIINSSQVFFQIYLFEKLKLVMEISANSQIYYLIIQPTTHLYQLSNNQIHLSSTFILTKKWISLCFDISTFFDLKTTFLINNFQIASKCKIKSIYEIFNNPPSINDGTFLVQRITEKRVQELIQKQMRAQSENRNDRTTRFVRKQSEEKRQKQTAFPLIRKSVTTRTEDLVQDVVQMNIKKVTGLQVIEEVQTGKKKLGLQTQKLKKSNEEFKKKAVRSFIRHSDFSSPKGQIVDSLVQSSQYNDSDKKQQQAEINNLYFTSDENSQSKYGKFSSTFSKPLGISSMNFKLASQNSNTFTQNQGTTQDCFYISQDQEVKQKTCQDFQGKKIVEEEAQQQIEMSQSNTIIEEKISAYQKSQALMSMDDDSLNSLGDGKKQKQQEQESSDEDLAESQFV